MRAEGKIGAVLAARLWGEDEATIMATGHDMQLHLLRPDGSERLAVKLPRGSHLPPYGTSLTVADLDGDGKLWPVVGTDAWRVSAITPAGELRWTFDSAAHSITAVTAGDLNGDGRDEIAVGTVYFCVPAITADGLRLWEDEDYNDFWTAGPVFPWVCVGDVDGDGEMEVVTAGSDTLIHCIDCRGVKKWTHSIGDDPRGLVVTPAGIAAASATGDVHLVDGSGERVWRHADETPCTAVAAQFIAPTGAINRAATGLCVAREDGRLQWLSLEGEVMAEARLGAAATLLLADGDGVIAATADGRVAKLAT